MNRFNLTFSGEILPGEDPAAVRKRFAGLFAIDDPARLASFFSGKTITLRRNLDRKAAAECFQDMHRIGAVARLVKISAKEAADLVTGSPAGALPPPVPSETVTPPPAKKTARPRKRKKPPALPAPAASKEAAENVEGKKPSRRRARSRKTGAPQPPPGAPSGQAPEQPVPEGPTVTAGQDTSEQQAREQKATHARKAREKAERAAKQRARREARKRKQEQEQALREAEEQARAEALKQASREAEAQAQREAREQEQAQREAEAQAQREAQRQEQALQEAEKRAQLERKAQAERAAREQVLRAAKLEAAAKMRRAPAAGFSRAQAGQASRGKVRTRFDVPLRDAAKGSARHRSPARKRQPGEPNVYALRPFRNAAAVRERAPRALRRSRIALLLGTGALTVLIMLVAARHGNSPPYIPPGAQAIASDSSGGLTILADNTLLRHDRSGTASTEIGAQALGLDTLAPPVLFIDPDTLLINGSAPASSQRAGVTANSRLLQRCKLDTSRCETLSTAAPTGAVNAVAMNPVDGSVFIASASSQMLARLSPAGELLDTAELRMAATPVIRLHAGLLLMNSPDAPAISVYRYDDAAFGAQLDEVLLLPAGLDPQNLRVGDFVRSADSWWVALHDTATGGAGVYRFGDNWQYLGQAGLGEARSPLSLTAWGTRLLVNDGRGAAVARFNSEGAAEAPFVSSLLQERIAQGERASYLSALGWRGALTLCALLAVIGLTVAYVERLRERVYRASRAQGAEPVDEHIETLVWVSPAPGREKILRSRGISLAALTLAATLMAVGQGASAWQLAALLTALAGPAAGLVIIARHSIGHIGRLDKQLLLVDHSGMYHLGADSRIQYRGAFLLMDDVVVFRGNALLPAFSPPELAARVTPVLRGGVKVDRTTAVIKLLQARHPLAVAAGVCALATAASLLMLVWASPV